MGRRDKNAGTASHTPASLLHVAHDLEQHAATIRACVKRLQDNNIFAIGLPFQSSLEVSRKSTILWTSAANQTVFKAVLDKAMPGVPGHSDTVSHQDVVENPH
jgi:hypothetical protein